jgi:O-antigen ligase
MVSTGASWRERPKELWIAVLGLGIALSPTNTKIAGAAWLLLCLAGLVAFFRAPAPADGRETASKAWAIACAIAAALAVVVALVWPDRPDTLHAEFRLLLAAVATDQLVRRLPGAELWRAVTRPAVAFACMTALMTVIVIGDRLHLPSNAIPWAVAIAFLLCILLPDLLASPVRNACRRWYVGSVALGFAAIFLSQSRAAFWVFIWAFWLVAAYWSQTLARINLRAVATVGLAGLVLAASTAWLPGDPLRLREGWTEVAGAMRDGNYNTSMGARLYNWSLGWESFKESPWVGIGGRERLKRIKSAGMDLPPNQRARFQEARNVGHVHNQYLHAAMDGGLIGLASTLAVLAGLGASAWRLRRLDPVASRQMQGVLFMHATAGLTNVNMAHNYYAIMLSLTVAVILIGAGARAGGPEPAPAA